MSVTEADHIAALSIAKLLGVELTEWQEWLLPRIFASHRERGTDNSLCSSALRADVGLLVCHERGPHRVHRNGDTTWTRTCGAQAFDQLGLACGREPHPAGTEHSSGAYPWL